MPGRRFLSYENNLLPLNEIKRIEGAFRKVTSKLLTEEKTS
jgi:hypothetical protein